MGVLVSDVKPLHIIDAPYAGSFGDVDPPQVIREGIIILPPLFESLDPLEFVVQQRPTGR